MDDGALMTLIRIARSLPRRFVPRHKAIVLALHTMPRVGYKYKQESSCHSNLASASHQKPFHWESNDRLDQSINQSINRSINRSINVMWRSDLRPIHSRPSGSMSKYLPRPTTRRSPRTPTNDPRASRDLTPQPFCQSVGTNPARELDDDLKTTSLGRAREGGMCISDSGEYLGSWLISPATCRYM